MTQSRAMKRILMRDSPAILTRRRGATLPSRQIIRRAMTLAHPACREPKTDPSGDKIKSDPPPIRLGHRRHLTIRLIDEKPRENQKGKGEATKPARHDEAMLAIARANGADQAINVELIRLHGRLEVQLLKRL